MSQASARIILQRQPNPRQDILTTYQVLVDGSVVGGIRRKQTKSFEIPPGHREIHLEWGKYRSRQLMLDLAPGQQVRLVCRPRPASEWPRNSPHSYMILEFERVDSDTAG